MIVIESLFLLVCAVLALPVLVFSVQVFVGALPVPMRRLPLATRPRLAVLIPAHNESTGLLPTLASVQAQLMPGDRLLVVADNCDDDTAHVAEEAGAEVLQRFDATRRGKGFALDYGVRYLGSGDEPPEVVVVVDADCLLGKGSLSTLACAAKRSQRPVQALYLMSSPDGAGIRTRIAEFAWTIKNLARPLGWKRLGLPCQLMGTGMAFPWPLIRDAALASGHIVEDLKLGLDFAAEHQAPMFCPEVEVTSYFPLNRDGVESQRTRWEHGHLGMLLQHGPQLLWQGLRSGNLGLFVLALDLCVPPLALLTLLCAGWALLGVCGVLLTGEFWPWAIAPLLLLLLGSCVLLGWGRFARGVLTLYDLVHIPLYALMKIPLYLKFMVRRQVEWVRSQRD